MANYKDRILYNDEVYTLCDAPVIRYKGSLYIKSKSKTNIRVGARRIHYQTYVNLFKQVNPHRVASSEEIEELS